MSTPLQTEWPEGPFLPPPEPREGVDGSKRYESVTYAAPRDTDRYSWTCGCRLPPPELLTEPQDILVGGQDQHAYAAASPITYVTPAAPRFLLVHSTADTVVPYLQSEVLARTLAEVGGSVRLVPVEGADHIFNGHDDIDGVVRLSVDYLAEALLPARRTRSS
jgi:acetyl esterase/lipase